jgi:hypothetical protein
MMMISSPSQFLSGPFEGRVYRAVPHSGASVLPPPLLLPPAPLLLLLMMMTTFRGCYLWKSLKSSQMMQII